jgi:hypothetical protein
VAATPFEQLGYRPASHSRCWRSKDFVGSSEGECRESQWTLALSRPRNLMDQPPPGRSRGLFPNGLDISVFSAIRSGQRGGVVMLACISHQVSVARAARCRAQRGFRPEGRGARTRKYVEHPDARKRRCGRCIAGCSRKLVRYAG